MDQPLNQISIHSADPEDPDARRCLTAYFDLLTARIPGVSRAHVPDPDPEAYAYRPPVGAFLVARLGTQPVACVSLKLVEPGLGEVKRLWVDPGTRGSGLGRRMMATIEDCARTLGMTRLRLDTNGALIEAIAMYRALGWADVPPFTGPPATHWFARNL